MRVWVLNPKCLWVNSASNEYQTNIALFCVGKEMHNSEKYYKAICKYVNVTVIIANLEVIEPRLNS